MLSKRSERKMNSSLERGNPLANTTEDCVECYQASVERLYIISNGMTKAEHRACLSRGTPATMY